ncbi:MAG: bifunctional pyr operon transcriptional regulator/uracil phosphoribosyltransferase [Gammaproteobacteria bacterium]|nr:MAG: bifunctional pyr operon transcriptional regulator/uracil phosphoribosyltransferase [Gammaproteobacteria bacterium]
MSQIAVEPLIDEMAAQLKALCNERDISSPGMVGIHTGGAWIAKALHEKLNIEQPLGLLDITFYRDDFTQKGLHPSVKTSELPFAIEGQHIILVDDAIMSGRTIRAAMNELFDYGRPASVMLSTLVTVPGRELPIQADIIGKAVDLSPRQRVKLSGPEPLALEIIDVTE